jgi:hypothetical protein
MYERLAPLIERFQVSATSSNDREIFCFEPSEEPLFSRSPRLQISSPSFAIRSRKIIMPLPDSILSTTFQIEIKIYNSFNHRHPIHNKRRSNPHSVPKSTSCHANTFAKTSPQLPPPPPPPGIAQGRQAIHSPNLKEGDRIGRLLESIRMLSPLAPKSALNTHSTPRTKFDLRRGDTLFFSSVERVL